MQLSLDDAPLLGQIVGVGCRRSEERIEKPSVDRLRRVRLVVGLCCFDSASERVEIGFAARKITQ